MTNVGGSRLNQSFHSSCLIFQRAEDKSRYLLTRFFRERALIRADIDGGNRIEIRLAGCNVGVAKCGRLHEFDVDFHGRTGLLTAVDVVSRKIAVDVGIPREVNERTLPN